MFEMSVFILSRVVEVEESLMVVEEENDLI